MLVSPSPDILPEEVKSVTGKLTLFKGFDLSFKERPPIALDVVTALADLAAKGYHLTKMRIILEKKSGDGQA
jgi:hypothetical protein